MEPRLAANCRHFTMITPHETKLVHPHAIPYRSYDEDSLALFLALIGLALMAVATVSMLIAFSVL
jgi:hypothetical protein